MLLFVCGQPVNIDRMVSYDFIATYGKYFEVDKENLHGDSEYSFGELSARRMIMMGSIRYLVTHNLIRAVDTDKGFVYSITESGAAVVQRMTSDYSLRYRKAMRRVYDEMRYLSDKELRDRIDLCSRSIG